jgi:hypothetical protein
MTPEQDREDLLHHEVEISRHESFNYAVLNADESELLGCLYIDPPSPGREASTDAVVSWWVVDRAVDTQLERALEGLLPGWLRDVWGFAAVDFSP